VDQIKVVPLKEKKRKAPSTIPEVKEKRPRMTIALLEKKFEDLSNVIYTLEQRIDEEHVYHKSLQHDLDALNHLVAKMRK
jgi:dynactin complex subunit